MAPAWRVDTRSAAFALQAALVREGHGLYGVGDFPLLGDSVVASARVSAAQAEGDRRAMQAFGEGFLRGLTSPSRQRAELLGRALKSLASDDVEEATATVHLLLMFEKEG